MNPITFSSRQAAARMAGAVALLTTLAMAPAAHAQAAAPAAAPAAPAPMPLELKEGDRVVFLGDTLIEREQLYGYLEQRLTTRYPGRNVTFRNLGWSGDTPAGESRASFDFDKPGKGLAQIQEQIKMLQPTVVIFGYGMASSFNGVGGVLDFQHQMNQLADLIQETSTNHAVRFVYLSPIRHENLGAPLPDPGAHNRELEVLTHSLQELAAQRQARFVSLYDRLPTDAPGVRPVQPLTDDGIHLTAYGYFRLAEVVAAALDWEPVAWRILIPAPKKGGVSAEGTTLANLARAENEVHFTATDAQLPLPIVTGKDAPAPTSDLLPALKVEGLRSGRWELREDGVLLASATGREWAAGRVLPNTAQAGQAEELRRLIRHKNNLFFDRWRPQNETYLFGFRKHEQGQNAKEIPMFDPLIQKEEAEIARLRQPKAHSFVLTRVGSVDAAVLTAIAPAAPKPVEPKMPAPLPLPEFEVAPGFEISLYAENPLLAKPIQMNFDPRGRLWVVSSAVYPQIQPGQEANDKVLILEDTKGTGHADKSTVFVDGLLTPTGVEPGDGGVYVASSTQLLHFKDLDGDGKADSKRVVLSGFGTEDTHHILHTLHWGPDGQLYFNQSIYIHSHLETPHGVERLNSGGVWHLRPSTMELGVFLKGFCNPWGHQFDNFGQSFETDGAGGQGLSYGIPGATYFTYAIMRRELQSISPGSYPKFCALELIQSQQFPPDWQGNAITCDFRAHRVVRFAIEEKDGGYVSKEMPDLVRSTNVTFRPIDVKLGPDGALYIADWSNPIIQHGEVDFRDPRRDHEHGRIWRVTAKGRPLVKPPALAGAANRVLFDELLSPNLYEKQQAKRVLTERGAAIVPDLARWTRRQTNENALLAALWTYQAVDVVETNLLDRVLNARDGRVRAAATRVVSYWQPRLHDPLGLLAQRIADAHPRVRIEAARALARIPGPRAVELVLSAVDRPTDPFVDYALWLSINDLAPAFVDAVKSGAWKVEGHEKQLEFALKAVEPAVAGGILEQVRSGQTIARDGKGPWIELIGQAGDAALLTRLFEQVLNGGFDEPAAARALNALGEAARGRKLRPTGDLARVGTLFGGANVRLRRAAVELAGTWQVAALAPRIIALAGAPGESAELVQAAFTSLRALGGQPAITALLPLTAAPNATPVRRQAVIALAGLDLNQGREPAVRLLNELTDANEALELWRSLLAIKGASAALTRALPKTGLSPVMAKAGLRAAREGGRNEPDLLFALSRGADLEGEGQALSDAELKTLAATVLKTGDAARGQLVFRRKDTACTLCHAIGGAGGHVGPDLTSVGASAQVDYLIESVLYPNRKIKEGYHSILVETKDDQELAGVLVRENATQLVLRNATDKEVAVAKDNIKTRTMGNSLMPSGLVDGLTPGDRLDLYRFLSELGKPGPYDASKGNVARVWRLYPQNLDATQFGDDKILGTPLSEPKWVRNFSFVDGRLPRTDLLDAMKGGGFRSPKTLFAATEVQVAANGAFHYNLTAGTGAAVWIDGKSVTPGAALDLRAGQHTIIVRLDREKLPEALRTESPEGTFVAN